MSLNDFYYPKSIAIVGASNNPGKAGYQVAKNILRLGFAGDLYFVNPKEDVIFERPVYKNVLDIPYSVDMVEIIIPAAGVLNVFRQIEKRGDVKAVIVMASGFSETGISENIAMEKEMLAIAKRAGVRVLGPNCVGVMNTENHLDTTFAANILQKPGGMSVISQSGSVGSSFLSFVCDQPVPMGFAKWGHVGNMIDVTIEEILTYYRDDEATSVIAMYMEGMKDARSFFEIAADITKTKPIVVLKVGRSDIGSVAAASHTGSLAGSDAVFDGAMEQTGVIRVATVEELMDTSKALSMAPLPKGNRIAILTEAGGLGVIAMDEIGADGRAQLANFSEATKRKLREILPPMALIAHPDGYVDMTAAADGQQHADALEVLLQDSGVDAVLLLSVPPTFLVPKEIARVVCEKAPLAKKLGKPVFACFLAGEWIREAHSLMEQAGIPTFEMPQRAARAMINQVVHGEYLRRIGEDK